MSILFHLVKWARGVPWISGLLLMLLTGFLGGLLYTAQLPQNDKGHFSNYLRESNESYITIEKVTPHGYSGHISQINGKQSRGNLTIYDKEHKVSIGDLIYASLEIREIAAPHNPAETDFRSYYASKHIFHRGQLRKKPLVLAKDYGPLVDRLLHNLRVHYQKLLSHYIITEQELALCQALLLGEKGGITSQMKAAFVDTGTMHILAVSGLHLGILYLIFKFVLSLIPMRSKSWYVAQSCLVIFLLWLFALLVGATSSVCRAATMFTLFEGSRLLSRSNYSLNSLSVAAFGIVVVDPMSINDLGFQLSFMALLGIILCYPSIVKLWIIESPVGHKIWQMVAVSLAAQLFTFPLSVYYFHQFPIYFWLSGLLAIPLAFLILIFGFSFFILFWIPFVANVLGFCLTKISWLLNAWIYLVHQLPGVVIENVWIDRVQFTLMLILMGSISALLISGVRRLVPVALTILLLIVGYSSALDVMKSKTAEIVIYYDQKRSQGDLFQGRNVYPLSQNNGPPSKAVADYRLVSRTRYIKPQVTNHEFYVKGSFMGNRQLKICRLDNVGPALNEKFPRVDVLWVIEPPSVELLKTDYLESNTWVVLDTTIPTYKSRKLHAYFAKEGYRVHSIRDQGAFRLKI